MARIAQEQEGEHDDRREQEHLERNPGQPRLAECCHPMALRDVDDVLADEARARQAEHEGAARQRGEDRRHLGIGDQDAVERADRHDPGQRCRQGGAVGQAAAQQLEIPGGRHRHDGDGRQVNAAADDDDGHADGQDAEHRHAAQDGDQVVAGEEPAKRDRRDGEQQGGQRQNDALLGHAAELDGPLHRPSPFARGTETPDRPRCVRPWITGDGAMRHSKKSPTIAAARPCAGRRPTRRNRPAAGMATVP